MKKVRVKEKKLLKPRGKTRVDINYKGRVLYNNFNNTLENRIRIILQKNPIKTFSRHYARYFSGYIWYDGTKWVEDIEIAHELITTKENTDLEVLIEETNKKYGYK